MGDLLSGDAIFRQRVSEIVDVASERVVVEYLETSAPHESSRGSWAVTLGISALAPPPAELNQSLVASAVEAERKRILSRLVHGGIVRQVNVTISSLQLFGAPMELLSASLDGESFYQIDTKPWVEVTLALQVRTFSSSTTVVAPASSASAAAFQNLRLRFLLARSLAILHVDSSSILVRDGTTQVGAELYGDSTIRLLCVEVHVGDSESLRAAVSGYLRNANLAIAIREVEPQWELLAVEVEDTEDTTPATGSSHPPSSTTTSVEHTAVNIELQVNGLPFKHVRARAAAILDATRSVFASALGSHTVDVSFGRVTLVPSTTQEDLHALQSAFLFSDGKDDLSPTAPPIDRPFVIRLLIAPSASTPIPILQIDSVIAIATSAADARLVLGFLDAVEFSSFSNTRVAHLRTVNPTEDTESSNPSTFVDVALTLAAHRPNAVVDTFALYLTRCALLLVLEALYVSDRNLAPLEVVSIHDFYAQIRVRVAVDDRAQRRGIEAAVLSWRFQHVVASYLEPELTLTECHVDLRVNASSTARSFLPGTNTIASVDPSSLSSDDLSRPLEPITLAYKFGEPVFTQNPSVLQSAPAVCPLTNPTNSRFHGCLVLRWSSDFPARSLFLQIVYLTSGATIQSTNVVLPSGSTSTSHTLAVPAPWLPDSMNLDEPRDWALQLYSDDAHNISLRLAFSMAKSGGFFPAFQLIADLVLADTRVPSSKMQIVSLRRKSPMVDPPPFVSVAKTSSGALVTGSIAEAPRGSTTTILVALAQNAALGLFSSEVASESWQSLQPACHACLAPIEVCNGLAECGEISHCFRRTLDERILLLSEVLHSSQRLDFSTPLTECLSSPSALTLKWSTQGRSSFTAALQCVVRSSCAIASTPGSTFLALQYEPREQVLQLADEHFPLTVSFLLDVGGGRTSTRTYENITSITAETLATLRGVVLSLYGELTRGMDVIANSTRDAVSGAAVVRIQYHFPDTGAVGLPFISMSTHSDSPVPLVEATSTDALALVVYN